jgi:uncharacterized protein (DUF952 family)
MGIGGSARGPLSAVRQTLHLVARDAWAAADPAAPYRHPSLDTEGFIHCTDGDEAMAATANRHYAGDDRPFVVLTVDLDRLGVPWRFDEPGTPYPHVYGPIDRAAIVAVRPMPRASDGTFLPPEPART